MALVFESGIQNPECKPLDDLKISVVKDGVMKQIPALHSYWVQTRCYMHYTPPPSADADGSFPLGSKDSWMDRMNCFCEDLKWFLHLEQHRFWSQMVYDKEALEMILSFLQEAPPFYAVHEFPQDEEMWEIYQKAHHLIFLVINRLATHTESKTEFMTPDLLGNMIYIYYIFTIPVLLDLCLLYGQENRAQLLTVIHTVFELQPRYHEDLVKSVSFFVQVLQYLEQRFQVRQPEEGVPSKLVERSDKLTLPGLRDLVLHILDTAVNLSMFLDIYTPACSIFHQQLFELKIVSFYEYTIPEMYRQLEALGNKDDSQFLYAELKTKLNVTRVEMLKAFRYILSSCINTALESKESLSAEELKRCVDDYVGVLTDCLADKLFMRDYHCAYNLGPDLDILAQLCPEIDAMKYDFLMEAALTCFDVPSQTARRKWTHNETPAVQSTSNEPDTMNPEDIKVAVKKQVKGIHLDSLISEVKDILPHLGDGFIELCLEEYEFVSERVVNAVLEDQLPPHLNSQDRTLPRATPEPSEPLESELTNGLQRLNVFDNDEFDIMTQDHIDTSRVHRGKRKGKYQDVRQLIDDKSHRNELREAYSRFGLLDTEGSMYDDEYDDTYDTLDVSVGDEGDLDRRPIVVPRVLRQRKESESSDAESVADEDDEAAGPQQDQFVANPEELRAQAEQRRLLHHPHSHRNFPPRDKDVVGRQKGQGQEKQVVKNRSNKTTHKSSQGNHNRRTGAQRKRQQGMMPS